MNAIAESNRDGSFAALHTLDDLARTLTELEVTHVHAGLFDLEGTRREKRLPVAQVQSLLTDRQPWSFIDALPYWDAADATFADLGYREEPCQFDPASLRLLPFAERTAVLVADYIGPSAELSPRVQLHRQIAKAQAMGFSVRASFEFEFILLKETAESMKAKGYARPMAYAEHNRCWSGLTLATHSELIQTLEQVLARGDVPLDHLCMELGPGCFEAAMPLRSLARAADDAAFFKLFTKAFALRNDLTAAFMAQLGTGFPGLGGHPILSLWDSEQQKPLFAPNATETPGGNTYSATARHFIAGVLHCLPELMALYSHTVNAYRRLQPGNWAPRSATWGEGNYTCGLRMVAGRPEAMRAELRIPATDTNPFLAYSAMLASGLYGIEQQLAPPEATAAPANARELTHSAIGRLPYSLAEATDRLEASTLARDFFGSGFIDHFVRSRRYEDWIFRREVSDFERQRYLYHV